MRKRVLLIGGSPEATLPEVLRRIAVGCCAIVAVDRGLDALLAAGMRCDLFCGDADSVSPEGAELVRAAERNAAEAPFEVVRYDPYKDDTDLSLALSEVARRWPGAALRASCMSGGAPDHALAVLGRLASWEDPVEVFENSFELHILKAGDFWRVTGRLHERFSFVPLTPEAVVSVSGMRWELDRKQVSLLSDLGISNVLDTDDAKIICHAGTIAAWAFDGFFAGA